MADDRRVLPFALLAPGPADSRTGHFENAVGRINVCLSRSPRTWDCALTAYCVLILAHLNLGQGEAARTDLAKRDEIRRTHLATTSHDFGENLSDGVIDDILNREAELPVSDVAFPADPFAR
jgi:hypothetical protein